MTAVEFLKDFMWMKDHHCFLEADLALAFSKAELMEKEQKIELLKSLVYSVCIGDDVEDVEEWLKEHELNKSE